MAGNDNFALSLGDDTLGGEGPIASNGNSNIALAVNLSGTDESDAYAGIPGNADFSAVFGDGLSSTYATNGDYLYDIMSPAGDHPGSAAATSGGFLAELMSLF